MRKNPQYDASKGEEKTYRQLSEIKHSNPQNHIREI